MTVSVRTAPRHLDRIADGRRGRRRCRPPTLAAASSRFDLVYRSLCAMLYNYVPMSGHPGGSISSGRFVAGAPLRRHGLRLLAIPTGADADMLSYAAGHKAMGLYAMWALRNEVARMPRPELLPADERKQLRLEDLLGFRRNPTTDTPLFRAASRQGARRPPDAGHARSCKLATGASGVGVGRLPRPGLRRARRLSAPTRRASTSSRARAA